MTKRIRAYAGIALVLTIGLAVEILLDAHLLSRVSAQSAPTVRTVSVPANDLVYDPFSKKIYASVPSSAGTRGNSITVINPENGAIEGSVFVGSEPNRMAISDDGQFIYVGIDGAAAVRRFNVRTLTPELQFMLGTDTFSGPYYVDDLEVRPGCPDELAVAMRNQGFSPRHEGVAMFVNGVRRTNVTPDHTGSNVIEFGNSPRWLYGYNNETTDYGFRRMSVTTTGLTIVDNSSNLFSGFGNDIRADGGYIYSNSGRVVNPQTKSLVGTYTGLQSSPLVRPDSTVGRTFFLSSSGSGSNVTVKLQVYDQETFIPIGSVDIPNVTGTPRSFIRWGRDGFAFRTAPDTFGSGTSQVYVVQSTLISGANSNLNSVSAASYRGPKHGRESIAAAFGTSLATTTVSATAPPLPTTLGGTTVKIKDNGGTERSAPLFYVSPTQVNYQIPPGTLPGDATITITNSNNVATTAPLRIAQIAPGLFSANTNGNGVAVGYITRVRSDNSQTTEPIYRLDGMTNQPIAVPIDLGPDLGANSDRVFLILFGTGIRFRSDLASIVARIGCEEVTVSYAGIQPDFVGLDQVNLQIPRALIGKGQVDIVLTMDGQATNPIYVNIK